MGIRSALVTAAALLLLASCGNASPDATAESGRVRPGSSSSPSQRYEATATVLAAEHDAMLCLGGILDSLPPQCGDVPVTNWDWSDVDNEQTMAGTTWGTYHVVGTFDGDAFTLTERPGPPEKEPAPKDEPIETPCPEPRSGWPTTSSSTTFDPSFEATTKFARNQADFAGLWIDYVEPFDPSAGEDPKGVIITAAFTKDLDRHEAELRELWDGPLCVWHHDRTMDELNSIQSELVDSVAKELGLYVTYADADEVDNVVELGVVAIDENARAELDRRYGAGTVLVDPALQPVD
jgi:hypothetical protein